MKQELWELLIDMSVQCHDFSVLNMDKGEWLCSFCVFFLFHQAHTGSLTLHYCVSDYSGYTQIIGVMLLEP